MNVDLYSRQILTIGRNAMNKIATSSCLIIGMTGLGIEVAKCLMLSGIGKLGLHDPINILQHTDICTNYYANMDMVGKQFVHKVATKIKELNHLVDVKVVENIKYTTLDMFNVVVLCDWNVYDATYYNKYCREHGIGFILLKSQGLYGMVFCDFGDQYTTNDAYGDDQSDGNILSIVDNAIHVHDPHKMYTGDIVSFDNSDKKFLVKVLTTRSFNLVEFPENYDTFTQNELERHATTSNVISDITEIASSNSTFTQHKHRIKLKFRSLFNNLYDPDITCFDINPATNKESIIHCFIKSLDAWKLNNKNCGRYPRTDKDFGDIWKLCKKECVRTNKNHTVEYMKKIVYILAKTCAGKFCPISSIIGSIGAQEVTKIIGGIYVPTKQFLYVDGLDILPDNYMELSQDNFQPKHDRYDGERIIFGNDFVDKINNSKIFIVGAGAIGCEHLKNVAMMGSHNMTLADMDHIELSNLSRQFLFKTRDIGKPKAVVAKTEIIKMNSLVSITVHENKVCDETIDKYDKTFFDNTIVMTALDNVPSRVFVDQLCILNKVPLIDSGTMGTKGNVQTVIPYLTESYGSFADPPDEKIPMCTLKMFPYKYEHAVHFALDLFEKYFSQIPEKCKLMLDTNLNNIPPSELESMLNDCVAVYESHKNFKHVISFAYNEFIKIFHDNIIDVITSFPKDCCDDEGNPFWTGNKKFPVPIKFDINNPYHIDVIIIFSHIWADCLGIPNDKRYKQDNKNKYIKFIDRITSTIQCKEKEPKKTSSKAKILQKIEKIINMSREAFSKLNKINFEKDDTNHIDFVATIAKLRSKNYAINCLDKLETKKIAGNIIPALATTTSLVSGLACIELCKIIYSKLHQNYTGLDKYRTGSFNIGIQMFSFAEPLDVKTIYIDSKPHNIWTDYEISQDTKLIDIINKFNNIELKFQQNQKYMAVVGSIICGDTILYLNAPSTSYDINASIECATKCIKNKLTNIDVELEVLDYNKVNPVTLRFNIIN